MTEARYQVGQRLQHPQFGEGLIVEVHTDRGREVLEEKKSILSAAVQAGKEAIQRERDRLSSH